VRRLALAPIDHDERTLAELNAWLARQSAEERVSWALENMPAPHALSSSFGAQAAVSLHLVTSRQPELPVILIDTGYLFPETYQFIDQLTEQLSLNLKVYRPEIGREWIAARHGRLWEQGREGIDHYNRLHKVEPMRLALNELSVRVWFAGLRRQQAKSRSAIEFVEWRQGRWKFHPIADWTDRDVGRYLQQHGLPYHPLWEQGYVSIGDTHTTRRWEPGMQAEDTRFFGLKRECGLHGLI
jgi:phosphoadenosine phosphosulfate reductase